MSANLSARAQMLTDVADLAEEAMRILGGGRAARLDPDALTSLAGAALALGAGSVDVYRASREPYARDTEMLEEVAEVEDATAAALHEAQELRDQARRELSSARAAEWRARAALAAAHLMPAATGRQQAAKLAAAERAQRQIIEAQQQAEVCEEALEILVPFIRQLRLALACLRRVPEDLGETYEAIYDHIRSGRVMPKDGDWLTGVPGQLPAGPPLRLPRRAAGTRAD